MAFNNVATDQWIPVPDKTVLHFANNTPNKQQNMGLSDIKKELKKFDKDRLIDLIADLYKKNKAVKELFDFYLNPNEKELFESYRTKVYEAFYPKRGFGFNLKEGKKAISDFKKFEPSPKLVADLMLVYVESGVQFTNDYGDIDENFYYSLESTYNAALTLMKKENLLGKFAYRAGEIVRKTDGIGWYFHDTLSETYSEFYSDYSGGMDDEEDE